MPLQSVNDFVIRFANVNGSGSASANELFARCVLRMGIPCAPRNNSLALAEPEPLTLANRMTKSFTLWSGMPGLRESS